MQTANERLESEKNTIQNAEYLTKQEKQALNDFIQELRISENISSGHTFAKHLQKLRNISRGNDWTLNSVEVSEGLCKEVRNQIQRSDYKQGSGDFSKKNKEDHWTAWKYFIEHIHGEDPDGVLPKASFTSNREKVDTQADTMLIEGEEKELELTVDSAKIGEVIQQLMEMDGVKRIEKDNGFAIDSLSKQNQEGGQVDE